MLAGQISMQYSYGSWYHQFAHCAFKSIIVNLTSEFVEFMHEEGLNVHSTSKALPQRSQPTEIVVEGVDYDPEDTYSSSDNADSQSDSSNCEGSATEQQPWQERFPQLHAAVEAAIEQLGGQVAPKLNWSSPTDALWISTYNSLKCCNADQVILLLKSSDRVMHDLEQLQELTQTQQQQQQLQPGQGQDQQQQRQQHSQQQADGLQQEYQPQQPQQPQQEAAGPAAMQQPSAASPAASVPQLVLRKWYDLAPEREFRCFVYQHQPVAISQRDPSQHFPQLSLEGECASIQAKLAAFHARSIGSSFPASSYAMDVYVPASGSVRVLDFNPICSTTSPLLFSWDELPYTDMHEAAQTGSSLEEEQQQQQQQEEQHNQQPATGGVPFRVVQHAGMIMPGARAATGMPVDMLGLQDAFEEVMRVMQQQQQQQQQQ